VRILEFSDPENWVVKYIILSPKLHTHRYRISEDRGQKSENRRQRTEDGGQDIEIRSRGGDFGELLSA
jgi:hypothetical protein